MTYRYDPPFTLSTKCRVLVTAIIPCCFLPSSLDHRSTSLLSMVYLITSPSSVRNAIPLSPWPRYLVSFAFVAFSTAFITDSI